MRLFRKSKYPLPRVEFKAPALRHQLDAVLEDVGREHGTTDGIQHCQDGNCLRCIATERLLKIGQALNGVGVPVNLL